MKIVLISEWFSEKMGYGENCLPKALALLGHDVHLITTNVQPYFDSPSYQETYEPFIGPGVVKCGSQKLDGYCLHRLPYRQVKGKMIICGLRRKLKELRPEIVQTFDLVHLATIEAALLKTLLGYKLFVESHVHASVFPLAFGEGSLLSRFFWSLYSNTCGKLISMNTEKCYPISTDAAEIATKYFGMDSGKITIVPLGVDTNYFYPPNSEAAQQTRKRIRASLGFAPNEIVCVYSGRFSKDKNPTCLAKAIGKLVSEGQIFRGLFIGNGPVKEVEMIRNTPGCVVIPFVPPYDLLAYYWASDIGVWPKQESTSQLDAMASGLPLILSNRIKVLERIAAGGLLYQEDDPDDLGRQILRLSLSLANRPMDGDAIKTIYLSWIQIAQQRIQDYKDSLI